MARSKAKEPDRVLICGKPDFDRCDNQVTTARYTALTFFPVVRCVVCRYRYWLMGRLNDDEMWR